MYKSICLYIPNPVRLETLCVEQAPDIKKMEANIRTLFREGKVNMAFMVMISMNLQRVSHDLGAFIPVVRYTRKTFPPDKKASPCEYGTICSKVQYIAITSGCARRRAARQLTNHPAASHLGPTLELISCPKMAFVHLVHGSLVHEIYRGWVPHTGVVNVVTVLSIRSRSKGVFRSIFNIYFRNRLVLCACPNQSMK